eukprot:10565878-Ditylum_brightwellii.AAC.1
MEDPKAFLREEMNKLLTLKDSLIGPPMQYLGNKVTQIDHKNGTKCWSFSSLQYIQNAVKNVEKYFSKCSLGPLPRTKAPWPSKYCPETDITPELNSNQASYFQSLIGSLVTWILYWKPLPWL